MIDRTNEEEDEIGWHSWREKKLADDRPVTRRDDAHLLVATFHPELGRHCMVWRYTLQMDLHLIGKDLGPQLEKPRRVGDGQPRVIRNDPLRGHIEADAENEAHAGA